MISPARTDAMSAPGRRPDGDPVSGATPLSRAAPVTVDEPAFTSALAAIAAGAAGRDASPDGAFPADALAALRRCGVLAGTAVSGSARPPAAGELSLVRRCAEADGAVGRIVDGHLNGVERIAVHAGPALRDRELAAVQAGELLLGVWGGDPRPGEGAPAQVRATPDGDVLGGVKTFCSGAGGVQHALVLARGDDPATRVLVLCDVRDPEQAVVDRSWYRSRGLVASASHRVEFRDVPVIARLGAPGAIAEQPWFGRDALRTAASWAGMADAALGCALQTLRERPGAGDLEALAAGRMLGEGRTIDVWLAAAAHAMDIGGADLPAVALHGRVAIADAIRRLLDEAARACGSHPFVTASRLDRARRDLQVFLLQHRLDPLLVRAGRSAIDAP